MRIVAHTVGIDAATALQPGRSGVVAATFARSCYVRLGTDWLCVGDLDIGPGPLNVPCRADAMPDWRTLAPAQRHARVARDTLILDGRWRIALGDAPVWRAPPRPAWTYTDLRTGLGALTARLPPELPPGGMAQVLARGGARGPVARAAMPAVAELEAWLASPRGRLSAASRIAAALVGLGPGLTPSGDDFLAGCLVALRATGRAGRADELWSAIAARGSDATNDISRAHLRAAARGRLGADLHELLNAILGGDAAVLDRAVAQLQTKPNHSPWDCLAGVCTVLQALAAPRRSAVPDAVRSTPASASRPAAE